MRRRSARLRSGRGDTYRLSIQGDTPVALPGSSCYRNDGSALLTRRTSTVSNVQTLCRNEQICPEFGIYVTITLGRFSVGAYLRS